MQVWVAEDLPPGRKAIGCKWVFAIKQDPLGRILKYKARLVAQGCSQIYGLDYDQTYSPVARAATSRIFFTIANQRGLQTLQADVVTAYLNGEMKDTLYMKPPMGCPFPNGKVCRIIKSLYGFKQSALLWREKLDGELVKMGFSPIDADPCIYVDEEGSLIITYVDDIGVAAKTDQKAREIYNRLKEKFKLEDRGDFTDTMWLGCRVRMNNGTVLLTQELYIDKALSTFNLQDVTPCRTPIASDEELGPRQDGELKTDENYLQAIGPLLYLATSSRPDISFAVGMLARYNSDPGAKHWNAVIRVFRYLKGTKSFGLEIKRNTRAEVMEAFSDADYAGDHDTRKSTSGCIIHVYGNSVIWLSRRQKSITRSTQEAEYIAASVTTQQLIYVKALLQQLGERVYEKIPLYIDNTSTISAIIGGAITERTKHIDVHFKIARDLHREGIIDVRYLRSAEMPADLLTKGLTKEKMGELMKRIGIVDRSGRTDGRKEGRDGDEIGPRRWT